MIKFRKDYYEPSDFTFTNAGERFQDVIELADPNGSEYDIKVSSKKVDIQEYINSFGESVDINNIVDRFTRGDFTAIPKPELNGRFIDISNIPDNIHDLREQADNLSEVFYSLPEDIRNNIGSIDNFVTSIDNGTLGKYFNENSDNKVIEKTE